MTTTGPQPPSNDRRRRKATDAQLIEAYRELGTVKAAGARFGMRGSSAHERLAKLGVVKPINVFTDAERQRLTLDYAHYREHGRVADLAAEMGRTVQFLSRQARALGLTTYNYRKSYAGKWKYLTETAARVMFDAFKASPLGVCQWCSKHGYDDEGFANAMRKFWPDEWEFVVESKTPLSTKYRLGRAVEYRVRDLLKADGYFVMRSPASKTPIDLVAIKPGQVLFVQCKRGGSLPPKEWNALFDLAESTGAVPIMAENPWPRCIRYWRLTGRKDGSKRRQPMEPFALDQVLAS